MIRCLPARKPLINRHYLTPDDAQRGVAQDTRRLSATDHTTYLILKFSGGVRRLPTARWDLEKILCCSARGSLWDSSQFSERVLWESFNTCLLRSYSEAESSLGELDIGADSMLTYPEATLGPRIAHPRCLPTTPPRVRARFHSDEGGIIAFDTFRRAGLRKNSKATYCPLGLRKNFVLQCTGFTLGQFTVL